MEDFLELNWEHIGMCRGSEGTLLLCAPKFQTQKLGFLFLHYFESFESIPVAFLVSQTQPPLNPLTALGNVKAWGEIKFLASLPLSVLCFLMPT